MLGHPARRLTAVGAVDVATPGTRCMSHSIPPIQREGPVQAQLCLQSPRGRVSGLDMPASLYDMDRLRHSPTSLSHPLGYPGQWTRTPDRVTVVNPLTSNGNREWPKGVTESSRSHSAEAFTVTVTPRSVLWAFMLLEGTTRPFDRRVCRDEFR